MPWCCSGVFVGTGVLLLTLKKFLFKSKFWFLVLFGTKTCAKLLSKSPEPCFHPALISLLSTLDRSLPPYLFVLFCLAFSVISILPCTEGEVTTHRSGCTWLLSFDSFLSTSFYTLKLARMALESFHLQHYHKWIVMCSIYIAYIKLLCHIQICSDAIVWRLKLRWGVVLISLLATLSQASILNIFE